MDDSTFPAVLEEVGRELAALATWVQTAPELDLATAETEVLHRLRSIGTRILETGLARRGTGREPSGVQCRCGERMRLEGNRGKGVQTLLGWITVSRAYYRCLHCGASQVPLDTALGLTRASQSPGVRRLAGRFGALLPFAQAATTLDEAAGLQLSPSTVRTVTETIGAACEQTIQTELATAWTEGWAPTSVEPPTRCYVAMDGVRILGTDGQGREVKLGMVVPERPTAHGSRRGPARYTAGLESAEAFGQRLAVLAHAQQAEHAEALAVLGDGAAWIWNLASEHFPRAVHIVDWYHASERIWSLGQALFGEETVETATWVDAQLRRLAAGEAATLATEWQTLSCRGEAAIVRDAQVTYFTNQASRMAYAQYRAQGWDIGSGMIESGCKTVIGQREKGAGMRWSDAGAQRVANVRLLLFNQAWSAYWDAA